LDKERCSVTDFSAEEFFQEEDARASGAGSRQPSWAPIIIDVGEDLDPIPPRAWLLSTTFCREFVSSLLAAGATGKTALRIAQLLALATGRPLTGEYVFIRSRVMLIGLEDGIHELRRRVRAAMRHYQVKPDDIKGWFYIVALPPEGGKLVSDKGEAPLKEWVQQQITEKQLDLVCLDPLVKIHDVEENDNGAIEQVIGTLARLAVTYNIAVDVPHHISKGTADPGNADRGRGASSFKDGGRLVFTLTAASEDEAERFGIPADDRRRYIRLDPGKVNLAPSAKTRWFQLIGVKLDNATELYPAGDELQVTVPWSPPETWAGLSTEALNMALDEIEAGLPSGQRYSGSPAAKERAAWAVVQQYCPDKSAKQCREIVATWLKNGVLYNDEYKDPLKRDSRIGLRLNAAKRPT
jgi:hypothetical protein